MQAIIMAAGKGSRLGELTKGKPKSFLEIKGKKLIEYNVRLLKRCGIKEIIIVTGFQEECFRELFENDPEIKFIWNPFYEQVNVLGSFYMGMEALNDDFVYLHADTLCDISMFEDLLKQVGEIVLPIDFKPCDDEAMKVAMNEGRITKISKNIPLNQAEGEFIGILKMKAQLIEPLKNKTRAVLKEGNIMSYFEGAIQKLMDDNQYIINAVATNGRFWAEIDFKEDYEYALNNIPDNMLKL